MNRRSLLLFPTFFLSLVAFAQPAPPYPVTVSGHVNGCAPMNSVVTITTVQNTQPTMSITAQLDANCNYSVTVMLDSPMGWLVATSPCNGVMQSNSGSYTVGVLGTASVVIDLNCGGAPTDCLGAPGGPNMPGTACDDNDPNTTNDTWSAACICVGQGGGILDCLGVLNGSALPGTPCATPNGATGIWTANCTCNTNNTGTDCLGVVNGTALPGTPCQSALGVAGIWTANCTCNTNNTGTDCLGVVNGNNLPGSPCWIPGTNVIGIWDANCDCQDGTIGSGCSASFWILQAVDGQNPNGGGNPIPYELWVWNLSQGVGAMTYSWDFGDGTTSTDPFPTHTYAGNGPYELCLTITDASGCTDEYCDEVSIDDDGILQGMIVNDEADGNAQRSNGFTINVLNGLTTALAEVPAISELATWPNPADADLYLNLNAHLTGSATISIVDVNGRVVTEEQRALNAGRNLQHVDVTALPAGMYTVRVTDRASGTITSLRFVRSR